MPQELRHTAASLAIASGADTRAVQTMLGHASAASTPDRYSHLFDDVSTLFRTAWNEARERSVVPPSRPPDVVTRILRDSARS